MCHGVCRWGPCNPKIWWSCNDRRTGRKSSNDKRARRLVRLVRADWEEAGRATRDVSSSCPCEGRTPAPDCLCYLKNGSCAACFGTAQVCSVQPPRRVATPDIFRLLVEPWSKRMAGSAADL